MIGMQHHMDFILLNPATGECAYFGDTHPQNFWEWERVVHTHQPVLENFDPIEEEFFPR